jgi:hypothetical protein
MPLSGQDKIYNSNKSNIDYVYDHVLETLNLKESNMTPYQNQELLTDLVWLVWATLNKPE